MLLVRAPGFVYANHFFVVSPENGRFLTRLTSRPVCRTSPERVPHVILGSPRLRWAEIIYEEAGEPVIEVVVRIDPFARICREDDDALVGRIGADQAADRSREV